MMAHPQRELGHHAWRLLAGLVVLLLLSALLPFVTPSAVGREPDASLTLTADSGSCDTTLVATGAGFAAGTTVTLFAGPTPGDSFGQVAQAAVAADGRFSVPVPVAMFLPGCRGGVLPSPDGQRYVVRAVTGKGPKEGDDWREPAAQAIFTRRFSSADYFRLVWQRTDLAVANGSVERTWMWGPEPRTGVLHERYDDSPGGTRDVQYFDKSRMEVNNPAGDASSVWFVTNGLLVVEMVEGWYQVGDATFDESPEPADIVVSGDLEASMIAGIPSITYADIARFGLRSLPARDEGELIWEYINSSGMPRPGDPFHGNGVTAAYYVPETQHTVASVFWDFMNSTGSVYEDWQLEDGRLFENPFYATGYPITEAYWLITPVGGTPRNVLWQCFERRCLTWTPTNPVGWQVEAGNVGLHYHLWRYGD